MRWDQNCFNSLSRADKLLKQLRPAPEHLFTGLKPGVNETVDRKYEISGLAYASALSLSPSEGEKAVRGPACFKMRLLESSSSSIFGQFRVTKRL